MLNSMEEVQIDGEIAVAAVTLNKKHYPMKDIKIQVPYVKE